MLEQNKLFRRQSLGNFETLLLSVSKDPAMIIYLDNQENQKNRPNENYAREVMELFTLGIGNYTEADIKDAAGLLRAGTPIKIAPPLSLTKKITTPATKKCSARAAI